MQRVCASPDCENVIPPQKGSARPRKFCTTCRPPRNRGKRKAAVVQALPGVVDLVDVYRRRLVEVDRLDSPEGALVMQLAVLLASEAHTAAGAAALSRELRAAMQAALRGTTVQADALDELSARRRRKALGG